MIAVSSPHHFIFIFSVISNSSMPTNSSAHAYRPPKRIANGVRISGAVGPLIPNPNPAISRHHKQMLFGTVICASECNRYQVRFDDGTLMECASSILRIEIGSGCY